MWTKHALVFIVLLLVSGCKDIGTQSQPTADLDETLRQLVVGSWKAENPWGGSLRSASAYRIDFRTDGTFADTTFNAFNYFQPSDTLTIFRSGNYSILNRVIEYSNVAFSYRTVSGQSRGFHSSKWPEALTVTGDSLTMTDANVLSPLDSTTSQLVGIWRSILWIYMSTSDSLNPEYTGRRQDTHTFISDSGYSQTLEYPDRSDWHGQTWQGNYYFSPPFLRTSAGGATENVRVEFFKSRMYWFYDDHSTLKIGRIR